MNAGEHSAAYLDTRLAGYETGAIVYALRDHQKVIYGEDDRIDLFLVTDREVIKAADAVVGIVNDFRVSDNGDGTSTLTTSTHGDAKNLCSTEPFIEQPVAPFCSGFLISSSVICTAGHCVVGEKVTDLRFVFGFRMLNSSDAQTTFENSQIYSGVRILGLKIDDSGRDWALVQLDRRVTDHTPLELRRSGRIADKQNVHVIGHPSGLPLKYAPNAEVRDNDAVAFFVANLDTYGGNSGSPVFNSDTHEVEGILARGEVDFMATNGCNVSLVCPTTGCRGEDCTRITEIPKVFFKGFGSNGITAALKWSGSKAYFFSGPDYVRVDITGPTGPGNIDLGYPRAIDPHWNFPGGFGASGIDAAIKWSNDKVYFFSGSEYIRVDVTGSTGPGTVDPGYPRPIDPHWNFPGGFGAGGIDAAIKWSNDKAYFFAGGEYIRVEITGSTGPGDLDPGYPRTIDPHWNFPGGFGASGIDAAIKWSGDKVYFFSGGEYIRVEVTGSTGPGDLDPGYPRTIDPHWNWYKRIF